LTIFGTNQELDGAGYSRPEWNALIIRDDDMTQGTLMHELSHQWWLGHCANWCCMNEDLAFWVFEWCGNCISTLSQNREEFGYKDWITLGISQYCGEEDPLAVGTTYPPTGYYQKPRQSTMTIQAYAIMEGMAFEKWRCHSDSVYIDYFDNPMTFSHSPLVHPRILHRNIHHNNNTPKVSHRQQVRLPQRMNTRCGFDAEYV